jgi:redox-sensing transcriptional repressor
MDSFLPLTYKIIDRLTLYHSILTDYENNEIKNITSSQIAALLKIDDSLVRKDIKLLNNAGVCKVGYNVLAIKESIEKILGFNKKKRGFIVGAGNLGFALAKYDNFLNYGFEIIVLFDNDPIKVDLSINDKKVHYVSVLPELVKELNLDIAVLTVPRQAAQSTADLVVKAGIKYIWNFAPKVLTLPQDVKVLNENLTANILQFVMK